MASETFDATGFLVIEPVRSRYNGSPRGAKLTRVVQKRPTSLPNGAVAVAITIQLPAAAFEPLKPAALIVVPEELIQHEVSVEAVDE